jgi:hypothetical protein
VRVGKGPADGEALFHAPAKGFGIAVTIFIQAHLAKVALNELLLLGRGDHMLQYKIQVPGYCFPWQQPLFLEYIA